MNTSAKIVTKRQTVRDKVRALALENIERQVAEGSLVIRQMTAEERVHYGPPRPRHKEKNRGTSRPR